MSLKFLNGLLTLRPGGRRWGSPSQRAHSQPTYKSNVPNAHQRAADITPGWAELGQPEPTFSPPKNRISLKFLNGLLTSSPGGRRMGSPSPRAHFQPT